MIVAILYDILQPDQPASRIIPRYESSHFVPSVATPKPQDHVVVANLVPAYVESLLVHFHLAVPVGIEPASLQG